MKYGTEIKENQPSQHAVSGPVMAHYQITVRNGLVKALMGPSQHADWEVS